MGTDTMTSVPVRTQESAIDVFGRLFEQHWQTFYREHQQQFEEFLSTQAKLTDADLGKMGVDKTQLAKQWCAAQMTFYLLRYGGVLGVHYLGMGQREDMDIRVVSGPPLKTATIKGGRMGMLLPDILIGRQFGATGSLVPFATFGDCDEIAMTIAQGIEAINLHSNLGMELTIKPAGSHAFVAVKFDGITNPVKTKGNNGSFFFDPTKAYDEGHLMARAININITGDSPEDEKELQRYAKKTAPALSRRISPSTRALQVEQTQIPKLEGAFRFVSEQPHELLNLARQANRLLWNLDVRASSLEREEIPGHLGFLKTSRKMGVREEVLGVATIYLAAFFEDFNHAHSLFQRIVKDLPPKEKVIFLREVVGTALAEGRNIETTINEYMQAKKGQLAVR